MLKNGQVQELIEYMDDLKITNEMVKEHIMGLSLDKKIQAQFEKIDTKTKTAFTREYNKAHKDITKGPTKKGGKKVKDEKASPSQNDDSEEDAQSS